MNERMKFMRCYYEDTKTLDAMTYKETVSAIMEYAFYGLLPSGISEKAKKIFAKEKPVIDKSFEGQEGRNTPEYRAWRKAVFVRDNYTCQICGMRGVKLNAHHIKFYSKYPALRYEVSNGITLCEECHRRVHRYGR